MVLTPSTTIICPVTYDADSQARNAIAAATSSGRPGRPTGVFLPAIISSAVEDAVSIQPGATAFTVIPLRATSIARLRVSPIMPALAALYAVARGLLTSGPVTDETFTIRPYFALSMDGKTAFVILKVVFRLSPML